MRVRRTNRRGRPPGAIAKIKTVIWEYEADPDALEKLLQAFEMLLPPMTGNDRASGPPENEQPSRF
jgi:hypothetical protein